ncbi:MAG: MFS transporter [Promethearchaeota archaeon]|jgi:GPH family glycoside/pentoside/hexuronide:cation symporter
MKRKPVMDDNSKRVEYEEHVPLKSKFGVGFANMGSSFMSAIGLGTIDIYYLKVYGANPSLLALSWLLFIVWNMVNDPIIGILEERTKTRWGRRIPYLRFGAIPYSLSFILVWFPFMQGEFGLFFNHLLMLFVFDTFFSMTGLITFSLPAEMAVTAKERTKINLFTVVFGTFGMISRWIMEPVFLAGDHPNQLVFQIVVTLFGIISGLLIFSSSYLIKERLYTQKEEAFGFIKSITETLKNKPFLIIEVSIFFMVIITEMLFNGFIYLFDYVFIFSELSIFSFIPSLVILILLGYWANSKIGTWGLKKVMILGGLIAMFGYLITFFVGLALNSKIPFELGSFGIAFISLGLVMFLINQSPLVGEAIDNDEIRTGKRRETTYSGVNALITKPAVSIAHSLLLGIIGLFGYQQGVEVSNQPETVATGVLIAMTIVPILCIIIMVIALYFNPLEGKDWQAKKRHLQEVHKQKEKDYFERLEKNI